MTEALQIISILLSIGHAWDGYVLRDRLRYVSLRLRELPLDSGAHGSQLRISQADDDYIPFDYVNFAMHVEKALEQLEQELPYDFRMERAFFHRDGLPGNLWFKSLFAGPAAPSEPESLILPGLQVALRKKDLKLWKEQTRIYKNLLKRLINDSRLVLKKLQKS